jgi:hypothetical protein
MTRSNPVTDVVRAVLLFVFLLFPFAFASAQNATATVSGTVEDQNGAVVPGVSITIQNKATSLERQATTNDAGYFTIPLLSPGTYTITARHDGFTTAEIRNVVLNVGDQKAFQVQLKTGNVNETVNVTAETPLINESPAVGTVVDQKVVENMPVNGRTLQTLLLLTPGVIPANVSPNAEPGQFAVNGQRPDANYFTIDGVSANVGMGNTGSLGQAGAGSIPGFNAQGGTNSLVSIDALQEFRIQTSNYAPEFGRTPGGQVTLVTRSGTNQFHGTGFDYLRNDVLDANDWFSNRGGLRKPKDRQNDFGGVFHGPIFKNKTFFFFSYEGLRLLQPLSATTSVPSTNSANPALNRSAAPTGVRPFLNAFPLPNGTDLGNGFAQFNASYSNPSTMDAWGIRVDHAINSKTSIFGRFVHSPSTADIRATGGLSTVNRNANTLQTLTLGSTQTIGSTMSNEILANYSKTTGVARAIMDNFGGAVPVVDSLAFPSGYDSGNGNLQFNIGNGAGFGLGNTVANVQRQFNLVDNFSITLGAHTVKFGADYRRLMPTAGVQPYLALVIFSGMTGATGALSGTATLAQIVNRRSIDVLSKNYSFYGQDTWRVSSRLTAVYGLRWDINPPLTSRDPSVQLPATLDISNFSTLSFAPPGTPLYATTLGNVAPRIGISYLLRQEQSWETVIRGGFGTFYDLGSGSLGNVTSGWPFGASKSFIAVAFPLTPAQAAPPILPPALPSASSTFADPHLKLPRTYEWNFAIEQSIGSHQSVSVTYIGNVGRSLLRNENFRVTNNPNFTASSTNSITRNASSSDYQALQIQFQRRLSRGLQAMAGYSWSHSIDDASTDTGTSATTPSGFSDPRIDRADSDWDIRQNFNASLSYDIPTPWKNKVARAVIGGWSVDNLFFTRSAAPVNVLSATTTIVNGNLLLARPNVISGVPFYLYGPQYPGGKIINNTPPTAAQVAAAGCVALTATNAKGAFCSPPAGTQGNLGRNVLRGFGMWQDNFALRRQFRLTEKLGMQVRVETFNLFNHPNFGILTSQITSALFGQATSPLSGTGVGGANLGLNPLYQLGGPRSIQFAVKLQF